MEYTTLTGPGMEVGRICINCMSFGTGRYKRSLEEAEGWEIIDRAIELEINFFDTVNIYSYDESERFSDGPSLTTIGIGR